MFGFAFAFETAVSIGAGIVGAAVVVGVEAATVATGAVLASVITVIVTVRIEM